MTRPHVALEYVVSSSHPASLHHGHGAPWVTGELDSEKSYTMLTNRMAFCAREAMGDAIQDRLAGVQREEVARKRHAVARVHVVDAHRLALSTSMTCPGLCSRWLVTLREVT